MNLPFWLLSNFYYINRPLISYDFFVCIIIMLRSFKASIVYLLLSLVIELVSVNAFTYQFSSVLDFIYSSTNINLLNLTDWFTLINILFIAGLLAGFSYFLFIFNFYRDRNIPLLNIVSFVFLLVVIDINAGSSVFRAKDSIIVRNNIAGSPVFSVLYSQIAPSGRTYSNTQLAKGDSLITRYDVLDWAERHPDNSILFVIVESFGKLNDAKMEQWMVSPLLNTRFKVRSFNVPFKGATTSGELRSLCALSASYLTVAAADVTNCLPNQLKNIGWSTYAFHGFSKSMFDRNKWWRYIGFQHIFFAEDADMELYSKCGSIFKGICDHDLVKWAKKTMFTSRQFVYLLTLDTHLPVSSTHISTTAKQHCAMNSIDDIPCTHIYNIRNTLEAIIAQFASMEKPPLILIVGDHAPPFTSLEYRGVFNDSHVPAYVLEPKP